MTVDRLRHRMTAEGHEPFASQADAMEQMPEAYCYRFQALLDAINALDIPHEERLRLRRLHSATWNGQHAVRLWGLRAVWSMREDK